VGVIDRGVSFREAVAKTGILADDQIERRLKRAVLYLATNKLITCRVELALGFTNAPFRRDDLRDRPVYLPVWRSRSNSS